MFLENKHKVIKQINDTIEYVIYSASAVEANVLSIGKSSTGGFEIIAKGQSNDVDEEFCKLVLPEPVFINNLLSSSMSNSYKCFCSEDLHLGQYIAHISAKSSWECLMNTMGNPTHVIIIQRPIDHAQTDTF